VLLRQCRPLHQHEAKQGDGSKSLFHQVPRFL
jgi:hypothetical protein